MLPKNISMEVMLKKITRIPFCGFCVILKMDMKKVKILLNLALKGGTSQIFLKSLLTSKSLEIIS
jgi:hypothetical protein